MTDFHNEEYLPLTPCISESKDVWLLCIWSAHELIAAKLNVHVPIQAMAESKPTIGYYKIATAV